MTDYSKELPVYVITSSNWTMEVPLSEYNASFDTEAQVLEAATHAIEVFYELKKEPKIVMNPESRDETAFLGSTLLVHPKGENPENTAVVFTHVCLANIGLYKESVRMNLILEDQLNTIKKKKEAELKQDLSLFDELKEQVKKEKTAKLKKTTKPKKPKNP